MRIALAVEYDGVDFCGWQSQPNGCGVQDAIEKAIANIAKHAIRVHAAGRTDKGVHALMQVAHFDTTTTRPIGAWIRGVNAFLPNTIRVLWAKVVADTFHARFSATSRHYEYVMINSPIAPAVLANKIGWYHLPLDVRAMQLGIKYFIGEHDFSAFRASECQAKSAVKTLQEAVLCQHGKQLAFRFSANAFLQHQVRNMIGALIYVGNGRQSPEFIKQLLECRHRTLAPPTFAAKGLYLTGVGYEKKWHLPETHKHLAILL